MNYRTLRDDELVVLAEARLVELANAGIPRGELWPEVLHRLARHAGIVTHVEGYAQREAPRIV
jgi:hypothetical protein